jgi:hypothetical protein
MMLVIIIPLLFYVTTLALVENFHIGPRALGKITIQYGIWYINFKFYGKTSTLPTRRGSCDFLK